MQHRFLLGTRKGLFVVERTVHGWRSLPPHFPGLQIPAVLTDPRDGAWYAVVHHGHFGTKLHRSADSGRTWKEIAAPAFPPKPADAPEIRCPMRGVTIPWSVELAWCLEAGGDDQPGRLWCGTVPGGLFKSDNHGDSWSLVTGLWNRPERAKWFGGGYDYPGIHSILVDPRDPTRLGVGVSCGGYWVSEDDGATWANRSDGMRAAYLPPDQADDPDTQDPHRISRCLAEPDVLWCQHHNGIFRSTDDGRFWKAVPPPEPSGFGFAVAAHPIDPQTALFAPAEADVCRIPKAGRFVLTRTRDGGKGFETLTRGLPLDEAYDLVYRHGIDTDATGNRVAVGSTSGGVWVSEDGGDGWMPLPVRFPPVLTVRFV